MRFICYGYSVSDSTGRSFQPERVKPIFLCAHKINLIRHKSTNQRQNFSSYTFKMCQSSTASIYQQQTMNASAEMLASAMMLMSLSETAVVHTGYNSRSIFTPSSSANNSGTSLSGWGNATTRKSYKVDLYLLGSSASQPKEESSSHEESDESNTDTWCFFDMK